MKTTLIILSLAFVSLSLSAAEKIVIKTCMTQLQMPQESRIVESKFEIIRKVDSALEVRVTQTADSSTYSYLDEASIEEDQVRAGLTADNNDEDGVLNLAERLVVHAMFLTEDPILKGAFSAGLVLKDVRSAKVYSIGKPTNMGIAAIVEAKDKDGKVMGSFLGGFLVTPCNY